jgi:hypothetical protein
LDKIKLKQLDVKGLAMDDLFDDDVIETKAKTTQSNKEEAQGQKGKKK